MDLVFYNSEDYFSFGGLVMKVVGGGENVRKHPVKYNLLSSFSLCNGTCYVFFSSTFYVMMFIHLAGENV